MRQRKCAFTLIELAVALVIILIFVTLGISQYFAYREKIYDQEAETNLRLVHLAERNYYIDNASYYPDPVGKPATKTEKDITKINENLWLALNADVWGYEITTTRDVADKLSFCVQAERNNTGKRKWHINGSTDDKLEDPVVLVKDGCP